MSLGIEYGGIASATIETCGFNLGEEQLEAGGSVQLKEGLNSLNNVDNFLNQKRLLVLHFIDFFTVRFFLNNFFLNIR